MKISLHNISKSFGKKEVITNLSLDMEDGRFTTLLGSSGCGKTTLLRMLAGLETPDGGEILFDDTPVFSKEKGINVPPEKRNLSFVFQDFALWPHMTVFENVAFGLRARKQKEHLKERVQETLDAVKLSDLAARYPHELSGGQQQRVSFARAIIMQPQCILFDEPLSALDAKLRESMRLEMKQMTSQLNMTSVFVTHDQSEAMSMSDYIVVMNGGKIEQYGTPQEIYEHPATKFVADFVGKADWLKNDAMVRPEAVKIKADGEISGKVTSSQYIGGQYILGVEVGENSWTLSSDISYRVGERVNLTYNREKTVRFAAQN
ncbi:MAG TPA: ABC transporter ATP-binding protein [Candidatus Coproplasma excrementigallinarum]|uniref:ABC-type quaternary amine transporter n=1 Tax=Candidatus Coproplasma excrementigallinarum TaxID=2840747 RepID=A0A9D1MKN3_9FIRM|nr:ABC transporter ATP-binding protein [Candidatus Coproplasma excrementigallinarum]